MNNNNGYRISKCSQFCCQKAIILYLLSPPPPSSSHHHYRQQQQQQQQRQQQKKHHNHGYHHRRWRHRQRRQWRITLMFPLIGAWKKQLNKQKSLRWSEAHMTVMIAIVITIYIKNHIYIHRIQKCSPEKKDYMYGNNTCLEWDTV